MVGWFEVHAEEIVAGLQINVPASDDVVVLRVLQSNSEERVGRGGGQFDGDVPEAGTEVNLVDDGFIVSVQAPLVVAVLKRIAGPRPLGQIRAGLQSVG